MIAPQPVDKIAAISVSHSLNRYMSETAKNGRLYACVLWHHFEEELSEQDSRFLEFLFQHGIGMGNDKYLPKMLQEIRADFSKWIAEFEQQRKSLQLNMKLADVSCPKIEQFIERSFTIPKNVLPLFPSLKNSVPYSTLMQLFRYSYCLWLTSGGTIDISETSSGTPFTAFAPMDRAAFAYTVMRTFRNAVTGKINMLLPRGARALLHMQWLLNR